jgi:hypothetical protein
VAAAVEVIAELGHQAAQVAAVKEETHQILVKMEPQILVQEAVVVNLVIQDEVAELAAQA